MSDDSHDSDGASTWTQPRFVIAALVVALIAVFAAVLTVTGPADGNGETPPRAEATSSPATARAASDSACGLEPGDQTIPVTPPPDTQWELVGTIAVPTAPNTIGPGDVDEGLRSCFARSPMGALYAAVNFIASASDSDLRARAVRSLTASGPGRDRALQEAEGPQADSSGGVQIAGFTFLNYGEDAATVDLAFRATPGNTTGLVHLPLSLRWEDGDWKVVVPDSGDLFPGLGPLPDLTGYAPWSGV